VAAEEVEADEERGCGEAQGEVTPARNAASAALADQGASIAAA
jgi:hypothetical protein